MLGFLKKIFPSHNDKIIKKYRCVVTKINDLSSAFSELSHDEILAKTEELKVKYKENRLLVIIYLFKKIIVDQRQKRAD